MKRYIRAAIKDILSEDIEMQLSVAENKATPAPTLSRLADSPYWDVREMVARRTKDPELLWKLHTDKDYRVRAIVAWNSHTPSEILSRMAETETSSYVLEFVAFNENTPIPILQKFSTGKDFGLRTLAEGTLGRLREAGRLR